jgi:hypothetical protein
MESTFVLLSSIKRSTNIQRRLEDWSDLHALCQHSRISRQTFLTPSAWRGRLVMHKEWKYNTSYQQLHFLLRLNSLTFNCSRHVYLNLTCTVYCIFFSLWLCRPFGPWPLFQFLNLYRVCRTPWTGDQPITRPLPTHRATKTHNKRTRTSMPRVGFESTIPVFKRTKRVHALDRAVTVIDFIAGTLREISKKLLQMRDITFVMHYQCQIV